FLRAARPTGIMRTKRYCRKPTGQVAYDAPAGPELSEPDGPLAPPRRRAVAPGGGERAAAGRGRPAEPVRPGAALARPRRLRPLRATSRLAASHRRARRALGRAGKPRAAGALARPRRRPQVQRRPPPRRPGGGARP